MQRPAQRSRNRSIRLPEEFVIHHRWARRNLARRQHRKISERTAMATDPNVPPPEPVVPLSTPPNPGEVQTTPMPMVFS